MPPRTLAAPPDRPLRSLARELEQSPLYSEELGISLRQGSDRELFRWFLASLLFGGHISETIARNTYRAFAHHRLLSPRAILRAGWDTLVDPVMREGGYVRYDGRKSTQVLRDCEILLSDYGGRLSRLHAQARDAADLEGRLLRFYGVGPITTNIFLRELRPFWRKADPEPLPAVRELARALGIDLDRRDRKSLAFARTEAGLVRMLHGRRRARDAPDQLAHRATSAAGNDRAGHRGLGARADVSADPDAARRSWRGMGVAAMDRDSGDPERGPERTPMRRIVHVDMDAFFAAAERLRRPELTGQPIVVGGRGDPTERGVVSSASYEARCHGVRSGMPLRTAHRRCPTAVFLPVDLPYYRELSERFHAVLREFTDQVEEAGIDEAFADVSQLEGTSEDLARVVQTRIHDATGLSCSVGVAPNKLLAKMASDLQKPCGLTVLQEGDLEARIWPLPTRALRGVGPKTAARLAVLGARTIGDVARLPLERLTSVFGPGHGGALHRAAHGIDESPLMPVSEPKSHGRAVTFQRDVSDWRVVARALGGLSRDVARRLREEGVSGRHVTVTVRYADFETHHHGVTLPAPTDDLVRVRHAAFRSLRRFELARQVRMLGLRVGGLEHRERDPNESPVRARLLITARGLRAGWRTQRALREIAPEARIRGTGFRGIFLMEAPGDALALAERVSRASAQRIGRALAVLAEVASERQGIEEAAVAIARGYVAPAESFCFRLHKRGSHGLSAPSHELERAIGGAIWKALRERDGSDPRVDLDRPEATVSAEILGPRALVCLQRRAWLPEEHLPCGAG